MTYILFLFLYSFHAISAQRSVVLPPEPDFPYRLTTPVTKNPNLTRYVHLMKSVFIGVDGRYSLPNSQTAFNYGPVMGIQLPFNARMWAGSNIPDIRLSERDGYRFGSGISFWRMNLNLEHLQNRFKTLGSFEEEKQLSNNTTVISLNFLL